MEKIICKQACSYVFVQENYIKAHVLMYFLHLMLTFTPPLHHNGKGSIELKEGGLPGQNEDLASCTDSYVLPCEGALDASNAPSCHSLGTCYDWLPYIR